MIVRLGYAVLSKTLEAQKLFRTLTYTNYLKQEDTKLEEVINHNLWGLEEIIKYNIKNNIHFYRLNSSLIPLATHKDVTYNYVDKIQENLTLIGKIIKENNLRIDTHPDQYCVLNSTKEKVVKDSIEILNYEATILKMLKISNPHIILHIGSSEGGKEASLKRFKQNFRKLDKNIQKMLVLENDDKIYNVVDTLKLCEELNIPMVLDYHHYLCNNESENIDDYLLRIFKTWKEETPKMHYSSPKSKLKKEFRTHHDYINVEEFISLLNILKKYQQNVDIMIEAKMKDEALFRLMRELKYLTNYEFIDETSFKI